MATYPHLVMRVSIVVQRQPIEVRYGEPSVDICSEAATHSGAFVQHPEPFDADGRLNAACRALLIDRVQGAVRRAKFPIRMCLVWSPTSCSFVEAERIIASSEPPTLIELEQ